jgi:hypothetical protein
MNTGWWRVRAAMPYSGWGHQVFMGPRDKPGDDVKNLKVEGPRAKALGF